MRTTKKQKEEFECSHCRARFPKWSGKCPECDQWDTLLVYQSKSGNSSWVDSTAESIALNEISIQENEYRWQTGVEEFDRVTGGGIVEGSIGLIGGSPGVGKSTLILQLLSRIAKLDKTVLYVSGEESAAQIKSRADRLTLYQEKISLFIESSIETILHHIQTLKPDFVVIDSIQTLYSESYPSAAGSVTQVRESASFLVQQAKRKGTTVMLIGHVTKEGNLAGPKTLEHMVDYVFYLEGEKDKYRRVLRSVKNRFGQVNEIGLFKMTDKGLVEVKNPNRFYTEHLQSGSKGTSFIPTMEGSRSFLVEIQALVGETPQQYSNRTANGFDRNKLQLIVAILEKHLKMDFNGLDIYMNLAGGIRINEPAMDMAIIAALFSSHLNILLPENSVFFGEIALTGEFRSVSYQDDRIKECLRSGFTRILTPDSANSQIDQELKSKIIPIKDVQQLLEWIRQ